MLSKVVAVWLAVLVIVPFTAPFPTCDLASFAGDAEGPHRPLAPRSSVTSTTDVAVPWALFDANAGRLQRLASCRVLVTSSSTAGMTTMLTASVAPACAVQERTVLCTVLRI